MFGIEALAIGILALAVGILASIFLLLAESRLTWRRTAEMATRQFYWWFHYSP